MKKLLFAILLALATLLPTQQKAHAVQISKQDLIKPAVHAVHATSLNSVRVIMVNLHYVEKVNYVLSYTSKGEKEGIIGNFESGFPIFIKSLYLGTCSGDICTPDEQIKNIGLEVTYTFKNGKTSTHLYAVQ